MSFCEEMKHQTLVLRMQQPQQTGICGDNKIGPFIINEHLNYEKYLVQSTVVRIT